VILNLKISKEMLEKQKCKK